MVPKGDIGSQRELSVSFVSLFVCLFVCEFIVQRAAFAAKNPEPEQLFPTNHVIETMVIVLGLFVRFHFDQIHVKTRSVFDFLQPKLRKMNVPLRFA